jgi:vacuolar-type H+-ATPase subunit H
MKALTKLSEFPTLVNEAIEELNTRKKDLQKEIKEKEEKLNEKAKSCESLSGEEKKQCERERDKIQGKLDGKQADARACSSRIKELESVRQLYQSFRASLLAMEEGSGLNLLTRLLRAENLLKIMCPPSGCDAFTLLLQSVKGGGSVKTSQNIFRTTVAHSGGAVVAYILFNPAGQLAGSGTVNLHGGFRRLKEWKKD